MRLDGGSAWRYTPFSERIEERSFERKGKERKAKRSMGESFSFLLSLAKMALRPPPSSPNGRTKKFERTG